MIRSVALLPALSLLLSAQGAAKPKPKAKSPAKTAAASTPKDESPVLARIGKDTLTQADLDAFLENLSPQQRMQLQFAPGGLQQIVKELAEVRLVAEKARLSGFEKDEKYQRRLGAIRSQLLVRAYLEAKDPELRKQFEPTEEEVKAYYDSHVAQMFTAPATFDVRHLLIKTRSQGADKDRTEEEMQARVKEVKDALAAGKPFEELAETYTDDEGSKGSKGLYTGIPKGKFVPEFEAACFSQEIGKVGEPVKTKFGLHFIRVEKRTEAQPQPFEVVKEQAKQQLWQEKEQKAGPKVWNDLVEGLKKEISFELVTPPATKPALPKQAPAAPAPAKDKAEGGRS